MDAITTPVSTLITTLAADELEHVTGGELFFADKYACTTTLWFPWYTGMEPAVCTYDVDCF